MTIGSNDDRSSNDHHDRGISFGLIGLMGMSSMTMAAGGKADRKLIVDGKPVNLAYAYASAQPGFFDQQTEDTRVLLTDVPLVGKGLGAG
jgi:hypothetical protein